MKPLEKTMNWIEWEGLSLDSNEITKKTMKSSLKIVFSRTVSVK